MSIVNTFSDLLNISNPSMHAIARRLRDIILQTNPGTIEDIRLTDRAAIYAIPPLSSDSLYCYIFPCTRWVHIGFYKGIHLSDPGSLLVGTGRELRYVKVHSLEEAENVALHNLIKNAYMERFAITYS